MLLSRRNLDFLLYEWLDVLSLTSRPRYAEHGRDTFDAVLDVSQRVATEHFLPHNRAADLNEPQFDGETVRIIPEVTEALKVFAQTGILTAAMGFELGGMQVPQVVAQACFLWFQAANVGTSAYPFLTMANANLLMTHGDPDLVDTWVRPMLEGRFFGTMCLSEPQAGSSLADITTRAEPQPDGTYRVFGNKMWISGGDHELSENIVHLVLAKIPGGPPGVRGISLFVVPRFLVSPDGTLGERNDVVLAGVNHKMGYRGTVNTLLNFGEGKYRPGGSEGAVGYLVGEAHHGLAYMFHMMNEARVGVGAGAAALGSAGYLYALDYASSRTQGRPVLGKDPGSPQVPIATHPDVARMLLAQKAYVEGAIALVLYCARLLDDERTAPTDDDRAAAHLLLEILTPIAKSWPSQWCLVANDLAIQVHGGYGYTRDYPVEQIYRDNRLNPIHEGTHGIQGLDLLGRKARMPGAIEALCSLLTRDLDRAIAADGDAAIFAADLNAAVARLRAVTVRLLTADDQAAALANSSAYLEATGHVVVAWLWLEQLLVAQGKPGDFYEGKRAAARYFFIYELPKTTAQFDLLERLDRTTVDLDPNIL